MLIALGDKLRTYMKEHGIELWIEKQAANAGLCLQCGKKLYWFAIQCLNCHKQIRQAI